MYIVYLLIIVHQVHVIKINSSIHDVSKLADTLDRCSHSTFNIRARLTFLVPVCTVPHGHWVNKEDNQQD